MNILILNLILSTAENGVITRRESIKDCMISNFANGLIENGHSVTLIASEDFAPTNDESYKFNIIYFKSILPKIFRPDLLPFPKGLKRYLKRNMNGFDMVISSEAFSLATLMACNTCKTKVVIWQELALHQKLFFKLPAKLWYNVVTRFFMKRQLIIPRSTAAWKFISRYSNNVSSSFVDHGANAALFVPVEESGNYFIIVSRLVKGKNIIKMIRKFKRFTEETEYSDYQLRIIGDGEECMNIKKEIERLNMSDSVILHGYMPHGMFCSYLSKAKAMLVDTIKDLNMVSIPEAIISGTPIVTNSLPTTAKYIAENKLGIVNDNWDYKDLADIISNYKEYHESCLKVRDELTNVGTSRKMVAIYEKWVKSCNIKG